MTKPLRAAVVSRALGLKFDRSETVTTSIRGWTSTYPGFRCEQLEEGVRVGYAFGHEPTYYKDRVRISLEECQAMQVYLTGYGNGNKFNPQLHQRDTHFGPGESYLIVTRKVIE